MAVEQDVSIMVIPAGADLSTKQYYFVKNSSNTAILATAAGEPCMGVLQNDPAASGRPAEVAVRGICKVIAGEAITAGAPVKTHSDGTAYNAVKGRTATNDTGSATDALLGSYVMGYAKTAAGGAGEIIELHLTHSGSVPTTVS